MVAKDLPVVSKKVVKGLKTKSPAKEHFLPKTVRTFSRAGCWKCIPECEVTPRTMGAFVKHLHDAHRLEFTVRNLAPLGLALCPFCNEVFAGLRGIKVHLRSCVQPRRSLTSVVGGTFPRKCWVWWEMEKQWYPGTAFTGCRVENCLRVHYPETFEHKASKHSENFHLISFVDPQSDRLSFSPPSGGTTGELFSLPPFSAPSVGSPTSVDFLEDLPTAPIKNLAFCDSSSVLTACDCDDLVAEYAFRSRKRMGFCHTTFTALAIC
jgi:hypothetical protein